MRNLAVEVFLTLTREGQNQHAVPRINVLVGEIHAVAVKGPVTLAPAGTVKTLEIVRPVERKVAAVRTLARSILVSLDQVDELEKRKLGFVEITDPFGTFRRPKVKAQTLRSNQVFDLVLAVVLTLGGLADFDTVDSPTHIIRSPFDCVGMERLVCSRIDFVVLFASDLSAGLTGNNVGLEAARALAENFDIDFDPTGGASLFGTVLVEEHGTHRP